MADEIVSAAIDTFMGSANQAAMRTNLGTITVGTGGTGATTLAAHGVVIGAGTSAVAVTGAGTAGQVLTSNGASADPTFQAAAGGGGTVSSVALTVPAFLSVSGSPVTTTGTLAVVLSGTALPVANGGSGAVTLAAHGVLVGNGTSAVAVTGAGTAGQVLTSNGASSDPTFQTVAGTGDFVGPASATDGNIVVFDGTTGKLGKDAGVAALNSVSTSAGAGDSGKLAKLNASGQFDTSFISTTAVVKGGTGQTSYTDGQLLIGNSSGNTLSKAALTAGSNITITNGNGTITIASSGGGSSGSNNALFTATADAANDHVASDTSIIGTGVGSKTTAANYFAAGTSLVLELSGYVSTALTPDTLNVKVKAGSTTVVSTGAITATASLSNSVFRIIALVTCRTAGASGTFTVNTLFEATGAALIPLEAKMLNTSTVTLDTTGTLAWDITAAWGGTTAGDVITGTNFVMFTPGTGVTDPGSGGLLARTALNTTAARTITAGTGPVSVTNGSGVSGDPTINCTADMLSTLGAAEIAITNASTALTIGRMHAIKATSADQTNALPAASGNTGKFIGYRITQDSTKFVTLDPNGAEAINGATNRVCWAGESGILYCDGSNYFKVGGAMSVPMRAAMFLTAAQTITDQTQTKVNIDTSSVDNTGAMVDTTNKRINIKRTSVYTIFAQTIFANISAASINIQTRIFVNGVSVVNSSASAGQNSYPSVPVTFPTALSAGDTVELYTYENTGASQALYNAEPINQLSVVEIPAW